MLPVALGASRLALDKFATASKSSLRAAATSRPRAMAVPEGASSFALWCSSLISQSQVGTACAASAARRASNAIPTLKFALHNTATEAAA